MASAGNGEPRFRVHFSGVTKENVHQIQLQAWQEGRGQAFVSAFRAIGLRLMSAPLDFGEPLYRLPALRMQIRHAVVGPLLVYFGVCEDRPLVFIKEITLLPQKSPE
jgi:hypothetical protein